MGQVFLGAVITSLGRNRPVEFLLRHFVARCGKVHRPQLLAIPMLVLLSLATRRQRQYKSRNDRSPDHFTPPALKIIDTFQDLQKICPLKQS